jgi:hypothetical protein
MKKENSLKSSSSVRDVISSSERDVIMGFNGDRNVAAEAKLKAQFASFLAST